jgi:hypothetical protein
VRRARLIFALSFALGACRARAGPELHCAHRSGTDWVAFAPDGRRVVTHGFDGLKLWTLAGALEHTVPQTSAPLPSRGVFDGQGHLLGVVQGGVFELTLSPPWTQRVVSVTGLSPNARHEVVAARPGLVAVLQGDLVRFVDLSAPGRPLQHQLPEADTLTGVSQGDVLVVATFRRRRPSTLWAFDLSRPGVAPRPLGGGMLPRALTLSPDGRTLALHLDLKLTLIDLTEGKIRWTAGSRRNGLEPTGFTADGAWLFAGDQKAEQSSWDVATGKRRAIEADPPVSRSAWLRAVSGTRAEVVFAREGDRLEVYDLDLKLLAALGAPQAYGGKGVPGALVTSPDGRHLAVEHKSRVHLWDLERRRPVYLADPKIKAKEPPCSE